MTPTSSDRPKRAALYLRVSTHEQTVANQERELREVADRAGHVIVKVYRDEGISGAKGRDKRPGFDELIKDAGRRKFNLIMAWSVCRLSRSVLDLSLFLKEIHALKCDLYLHQNGIDTTTPTGRAMFQMMGIYAELEREMISERVRAGMARAKAAGKKFGQARLDPKREARIRELLSQKVGMVKIGKLVGCGTGPVQRIKSEMIA
jgi:DNA invertase Pin-like site-specific DNA recombinase